MVFHDKYCQNYKLFEFFLKLGFSCGLILHLSANPISALYKTNRTGKTNFQKEGMNM